MTRWTARAVSFHSGQMRSLAPFPWIRTRAGCTTSTSFFDTATSLRARLCCRGRGSRRDCALRSWREHRAAGVVPQLLRARGTQRRRSAPSSSGRPSALVLGRSRWVVTKKVLGEAADRGQPAVSGGDAIASDALEVVEEREDVTRVHVLQCELGDGSSRGLGQELEEQAKRVAVRVNRVRTRSAHTLQMLAKEGLDEPRKSVGALRFMVEGAPKRSAPRTDALQSRAARASR